MCSCSTLPQIEEKDVHVRTVVAINRRLLSQDPKNILYPGSTGSKIRDINGTRIPGLQFVEGSRVSCTMATKFPLIPVDLRSYKNIVASGSSWILAPGSFKGLCRFTLLMAVDPVEGFVSHGLLHIPNAFLVLLILSFQKYLLQAVKRGELIWILRFS